MHRKPPGLSGRKKRVTRKPGGRNVKNTTSSSGGISGTRFGSSTKRGRSSGRGRGRGKRNRVKSLWMGRNEESDEEVKEKPKGWLKLETDYKKLNHLLKLLGVEGDYEFSDLLGFDEQLCSFVPKPVLAVILVHPVKIKTLSDEKVLENENPQVYKFDYDEKFNNDLFFLQQRIPNSCGTVAVIHSILSQISPKVSPIKIKLGTLGVRENGPIHQYYEKTKDLSSLEKGESLKTPEFSSIKEAHQKVARIGFQPPKKRGRGRRRNRKKRRRPFVPKHFTSFVFHEESRMIVELDGSRQWPIQRGYSSRESFLVDVCRVIMELYILKCPANPYDFAAVVLRRKEM